MTCGIYEIRHVASGKRYVGSSVNIQRRWWKHRCMLKNGTHHSTRLQRSWCKHGPDAFEHRTILLCAPRDLALYELIVINAFDAYQTGFNGAPTPYSSLGRTQTAATRLKLSELQRGKTLTPEHRAKISAANTGKRASPEAIEKMRQSKTGKVLGPLSDDHRARLSAVRTGRPKSPQQVEKMRAFRHTEESKQKVSVSKTGKRYRPRDPEHTRKQQEARNRTYALRKGLGV